MSLQIKSHSRLTQPKLYCPHCGVNGEIEKIPRVYGLCWLCLCCGMDGICFYWNDDIMIQSREDKLLKFDCEVPFIPAHFYKRNQ